jgi:hypothetical protein
MVEDGTKATSTTHRSSKRKFLWLLLLLVGLLGALLAWNAVVFVPVRSALAEEHDASIVAYRRWLVSPSQIVVDVRSVEGTQSMAGMDRMLLEAAEGLNDQTYESVVLAYSGDAQLLMEGSYFREIGATRQVQNPVYTMRTMQEHIQNLDGSPAFETWSGGWLGVLGKQLEDHNEFHQRWWLRGAASSVGM